MPCPARRSFPPAQHRNNGREAACGNLPWLNQARTLLLWLGPCAGRSINGETSRPRARVRPAARAAKFRPRVRRMWSADNRSGGVARQARAWRLERDLRARRTGTALRSTERMSASDVRWVVRAAADKELHAAARVTADSWAPDDAGQICILNPTQTYLCKRF
jgi:hypothetical protein